MLKFYLTSVIIWMIINYSIVTMFGPKIRENGWVQNNNTIIGKWKALFIGSAVPILRLLVLLAFMAMSVYTKEQYDKELGKYRNNKEN